MPLRFPVLIALGAMLVIVALAGCGASGSSGSTSGSAASSKQSGSSSNIDAIRTICLKAREGHLPMFRQPPCNSKKVGVTATSPPPGSPEAQEALRASERSGERIEKRKNEEPTREKYLRSVALVDLTEGKRTEAKSELKASCLKADAAQLAEAWQQLQKLSLESPEPSVAALGRDLEAICPL